ncbi:MAG: phage tail sheath family protein [Negativicutes bacterium]|nr:phage tail sheath family protein [Negativicutes bacterium]
MTGGTWLTQNKVRPGVYINFKSLPKPLGQLGARGIGTFPIFLSWGAEETIITLANGEDTFAKLGYSITDSKMIPIREFFRGSGNTQAPVTLLLWRLKANGGTKATATTNGLTASAAYKGVRGNDISVVISANVDDNTKFDVATIVDNNVQDLQQALSTIGDLTANAWVSWSGAAATALVAEVGVSLAGGTDGTSQAADYLTYLTAAEQLYYNSMGCMATDAPTKAVFASYTERLVNEEGRYAQLCVANYPAANNECITSVMNGVILDTGDVIPNNIAVAWLTGASAGAQVNQGLTYATYPDAVSTDGTVATDNTTISNAILAGQFVFTPVQDGTVHVEYDINTFTNFSPTKGKSFRKNRVIRVLQTFGNDCQTIFSKYYIGKVDNDPNGRSLYKGELVNYIKILGGIHAVDLSVFDPKTDLDVEEGDDSDAVVINAGIKPVDSTDKIYMTVTVN